MDILSYKVFRRSSFTYKGLFDLEDCKTHGDLYNKLIYNEEKKKLKLFYKFLCFFSPDFYRIIRDCWNINKIKDELHIGNKKEHKAKDKIAIFFPTWLGDCIMTKRAINIINSRFIEDFVLVPVISNYLNKIFCYNPTEYVETPIFPNTSLKHAKLSLIYNWFINKQLATKFIYKIDSNSFRAAIFFNKKSFIANKMKCPTLFYNENALRRKGNNKGKHRVDVMVQFMSKNLKKMGFSEKPPSQWDQTECFTKAQLHNTPPYKVGIFPFSFNHNKYKGWSTKKTSELINRMNNKYGEKIEIIMFTLKQHKKQIKQIKKLVSPFAINFCADHTFLNEFRTLSYAITVDTGSLHLAQFYNIPSAGLYGPTDPHETGPYPNGYQHCAITVIPEQRQNEGRIDKTIVLSKMLSADEVFTKVDAHLTSLSLV